MLGFRPSPAVPASGPRVAGVHDLLDPVLIATGSWVCCGHHSGLIGSAPDAAPTGPSICRHQARIGAPYLSQCKGRRFWARPFGSASWHDEPLSVRDFSDSTARLRAHSTRHPPNTVPYRTYSTITHLLSRMARRDSGSRVTSEPRRNPDPAPSNTSRIPALVTHQATRPDLGIVRRPAWRLGPERVRIRAWDECKDNAVTVSSAGHDASRARVINPVICCLRPEHIQPRPTQLDGDG